MPEPSGNPRDTAVIDGMRKRRARFPPRNMSCGPLLERPLGGLAFSALESTVMRFKGS